MTTLFIGNLTRQAHHFAFRLLREGQTRSEKTTQIPIQPGNQIKIPFNLTEDQALDIVEQHAAYGMTAAEVVPKSPFMAALCYSFDKPISGVAIELGFGHNDEILVNDAAENRANAVAATAAQMEESTEGTLRHFETQVTEVPGAGADTSNIMDHKIEIGTDGSPRRSRQSV